MNIKEKTIEKLVTQGDLSDQELIALLETNHFDRLLFAEADKVRRSIYGDEVYIRGLIEISNYCKNNCFYCGIRCENQKAHRYRLTPEDILECCDEGYELGFRTFVMQGGEDSYFSDEIMCEVISQVKKRYPECAVTLSLGERTGESYERMFRAGADRYLLRHETATNEHYAYLHPEKMSLENRKECLYNLKKIGYQVGSGFMVGSPGQTTENLVADLRFLQELKPDMIGIGPFIAHSETPLKGFENGSVELTLRLVAILRLMFPYALIPSTTALGTLSADGRERGLKAGANVVMPNLSPKAVRKFYEIYENKLATGEEAAQSLESLKKKVAAAGYRVVISPGHVKKELLR